MVNVALFLTSLFLQVPDATTLPALITITKSALPRSGAEGFKEPSPADRARFEEAVLLLLAGRTTEAASLVTSLNYQLTRLVDARTRLVYWVLREPFSSARGLGTYIAAESWWRNIVFEAPHPLYDINTPEQGATLLEQLRARALFIAGTHRCSNAEATSCTQATDAACDYYRVSDAAHNTKGFFQHAHLATLRLNAPPLTVSLHGNASASLPEVSISDGTSRAASMNSPVSKMRDALRALNIGTVSCNSPGDNASLCGSTNVQGRASNGALDACLLNAPTSKSTFLHIEQKRGIRDNPTPLIEAFRRATSIPLTLVNAASFATGPVAADSLVTAFGGDLAGARVIIGNRTIEPGFASDTQINFYLPSDLAPGETTIRIDSASGAQATVNLQVVDAAPGLFNAVQRLSATDGDYLVLYATGLRKIPQGAISITINGVQQQLLYAGPQSEFPGLDQINLKLVGPIQFPATVLLRASGKDAPALTLQQP